MVRPAREATIRDTSAGSWGGSTAQLSPQRGGLGGAEERACCCWEAIRLHRAVSREPALLWLCTKFQRGDVTEPATSMREIGSRPGLALPP